MTTKRLEAFSDGVLAIIITVMVLELRVPEGDDLAALRHSAGGGLLTYLLSFAFIGIYWNNHHHLFQLTGRITGSTLWANLHLLFWLSLLPFTTAWMDDTAFARVPVMTYGVNLLIAALAYLVLQLVIIRSQGQESALRRAVRRDVKGKLSMVLYAAGVGSAGLGEAMGRAAIISAITCFVAAAVMWLVPDRRIKHAIDEHGASP